ncbi:MAG: hypothetical protein ACP5RR_09430 [Candidatus Kapaibacteriota bacterium]
MKKFLLLLFFLVGSSIGAFSKVSVIPTDSAQNDFLRAYKFALQYSHVDYRFTNATMDSLLFPKFGEYSIYWIAEGEGTGSFVYPDVLPKDFSNLTKFEYPQYEWRNSQHFSLQIKLNSQLVCIFQSEMKQNNATVTWASFYYKNLFDLTFYDNMYYFANEKTIDSIGISGACRLLIIPPFRKFSDDDKYYIDKIFAKYPNIKRRFDEFLARGGTIYAEGNAVYFLEKLGYLENKSVDFANSYNFTNEGNIISVDFTNINHPLAFTRLSVGKKLYGGSFPKINTNKAEVVAYLQGTQNPVVFLLRGKNANGGKIVVNTGLPTIGGFNELNKGSRQLEWTLNAIFSAFCSEIDVTRSIYNNLPPEITAGVNAISYDRLDTFELRIKIRNLSAYPMLNVTVTEWVRDYFQIIGVQNTNISFQISGNKVTLNNIALNPFEEKEIVILISTPDPNSKIHEEVNKYISWANYVYVSYCEVKNESDNGLEYFAKFRNYADLMFSARLIADTDLNWKNILYLDFQPFKVFTIIENKERTPAIETKYVQYIPKDVPFYWTDNSIDIPILKTPGGKFVDVLYGSNDKNKPEYDMDSDGYPDVWLDTASIYPKGYSIEETEVYWLNPWEYYRSGDSLFYEDIDHDGKRAIDVDGDGIVDIEEPGDKIRVWKVTWDIGKIAGYEYFDPYCYYEIWLDPPDLVKLSAGVGKVYGTLDEDVPGMFYPYAKDIIKADKNDQRWKYWMETDKDGNPLWKQFIYQKIHNYEGFTFIDTMKENYRLKPTDHCVGTVPQPHREFIAVLSLGGRDIDMNSPVTTSSRYSNLTYKTIFNETRTTPIRTTYTYWAPLPNPLQFEYLTNSFEILDTGGTVRYKTLPMFGKALLKFTIDASTEYSYYWIRNAGHDVDYNDPSGKIEGVESLGDGVFGYLIYDIPKGIGGYRISLPKKNDGSYDIDKIVKIDGKPFQKWLDNKNTKNQVEILEDPFEYHVYIPQILIPPALDDDNNDGVDDWIDDRGDRFQSSTGFLHDAFMLGNGEDYKDWPKVPFQDDIYGMVTSGWYPGEDRTYGDDKFEKLGKTRIEIQAIYEGLGKEGNVEISKGGWLVVEEIFGGSPWVITSHTLSGFAIGSNLKLTSRVQPTSVRYGIDTTFVLHTIEDVGEPHYFNINFDPFHLSYGYGEVTITTYAGGRDPSNLIAPNSIMPTIIDPKVDSYRLTILPMADSTNPALKGYPKTVDGSFLEVRVEINNSTDFNICNLKVDPVLSSSLKNTRLEFAYVLYPRPLVPAKFDPTTGKIIQGGDDFGTLRTGWRFNQPDGEMLVTLGNTLNLLQAGRRAYFIFLFKIDSTLPQSVYTINFTSAGEFISYSSQKMGLFNYEVPFAQFSISKKKFDKTIAEYQKFVIGQSELKRIDIQGNQPFNGLGLAKWSDLPITYLDFDTLKRTLNVVYDKNTRIESIDLSSFKSFPTKDFTKFYVLEKVEVNSSNLPDKFDLTKAENLLYEVQPYGNYVVSDKNLTLSSVGPRLIHFKRISTLDGQLVPENASILLNSGTRQIGVSFYVINIGSDIAENANLSFEIGKYFNIDNSQQNILKISDAKYQIPIGLLVPGEMKEVKVLLNPTDQICMNWYDNTLVVDNVEIMYNGPRSKFATKKETFSYLDETPLDVPSYDVFIKYFKPAVREVKAGETLNLFWEAGNGILPLPKNLKISVYAILNLKDTLLIFEDTLPKLDLLQSFKGSTSFTLPDSLYFLEFKIVVDRENAIEEICKNNNVAQFPVELIGPDWMRKVKVQPNPFDFFTSVSYVISQDISKLDAYIYTIDGAFITKIENCPHQLGNNYFLLEMPDIAKGTYLIRFEGFTPENNKVVNYVKVIKEK